MKKTKVIYEDNSDGYKRNFKNILTNFKNKLSVLEKQVNIKFETGKNKNTEGLKLFIIQQKIQYIYHQSNITETSMEDLICQQIKLLNHQFSFPQK